MKFRRLMLLDLAQAKGLLPLNLWRVTQSIAWLLVFAIAATSLPTSPVGWSRGLSVGLILSWLSLCVILRTTLNPANAVTALRFLGMIALFIVVAEAGRDL